MDTQNNSTTTDTQQVTVIIHNGHHRVTRDRDGCYYYERLAENTWIKTEDTLVNCLGKFIERTLL